MKVLHVLDHSLPRFSGYSLRSDYVIRSLARLGSEPVVVTAPEDQDGIQRPDQRLDQRPDQQIDGIDFYRAHRPPHSSTSTSTSSIQALPLVRQMAAIVALANEIERLVRELKIDLIHSHSPSLNGLAAARAAAQAGRPWIYELRYCDQDAAVDRGELRHNSLRYRLAQRFEQSALNQARCVVTTSEALRHDLVRRGVAESRIYEIPPGVDTELFRPQEPDPELIDSYRLSGKMVIGFVGSPGSDGGLEFLIEAASVLFEGGLEDGGENRRAGRPRAAVLLVGDDQAAETWRERIPEAWRDHFIFAGRVSHREMSRYYSVMDLVVCANARSRLTELTPSLVPLEAMAMGRSVVGSNLEVTGEWLKDGETGILVEAQDSRSLAACLSRLVEDGALRHAIGDRARRFVERERQWTQIAERYLAVYDRALSSFRESREMP